LRGGPSLVFAHSMGNNVFRYFLEWLKLEIAPKLYLEWLDYHIHAYYSVGLLASLPPYYYEPCQILFAVVLSSTIRVHCDAFVYVPCCATRFFSHLI